MNKQVTLRITPEVLFNKESLDAEIRKKTGAEHYQVIRRSIDARQKVVVYQIVVQLFDRDRPLLLPQLPDIKSVHSAPEVVVVGCGPAGLFAAYTLIQRGLKPVIVERGKDVRARRHDLAAITKRHEVNPDSNYCFGEGGAGTYSDGKLYTRSDKRGNVQEVLEILVAFGAHPDILIDAHPHIGTNKLPGLIERMRQYIEDCGGVVRFNSRVTGLLVKDARVVGVELMASEKIMARSVVLATGHSARDIYFMLHAMGIALENKPFAAGVRIEHPQSVIDQMQYHCDVRNPLLPPASYSLVKQVNGRGAYSFCMCPGGIIAPCATAMEEVVTNGWSPSRRNNPFANSGFVVSITEADTRRFQHFGDLQGLAFQMHMERAAWLAGGGTQAAPAQRLTDFLRRKVSTSLPDCSYHPGLTSVLLQDVLPNSIAVALEGALNQLQKSHPAYITEEAVMVGVESRTSSPVRIPRDRVTLQHPQVAGLYPCGEGGGYAGGIVSAALDGMKVAYMISI